MTTQPRLLVLISSALLLPLGAQDVPGFIEGKREYPPYPEQDFPDQVFFGDTHLHTSYSPDAGMIGNKPGSGRWVSE